ncbi:MAG: cyclic nucleotide-binding domain-containing protein [Candidatus Acidiferrales bacterium]|jgi:CRP-like cAMP-binding protein
MEQDFSQTYIPQQQIRLTIDDKPVAIEQTRGENTTIFEAAQKCGIVIPTLCHQQNEKPVGVCRMCVVDIGQRVYAASCVRLIEPGMNVKTSTADLKSVRRTLLELLLADHPSPCARQKLSADCELERLAAEAGIKTSPFAPRATPRGHDDSSLAISVDHEACILCDRCIRGCSEIRHNFVLARRGKGYQAGIAFDDNLPMGTSSCVSCGECMVSCPTGALTNKKVIDANLGEGDPVTLPELQKVDVFRGVSGTFLNLNSNAIRKRKYKAGEVICKEGDYGSTAFYVLDGKGEVFLSSPMAHVSTKGQKGFFSKLKSALEPTSREQAQKEPRKGYIPIDGPVDLSYDNPVADLEPGDLFGEMTCMNYYPRSATVRAKTDCTVLEMLRNVLDIMRRNRSFRARIEQNYRKRALESHLRGIPIFSSVTPAFISHLRDRVELRQYSPGQLICRQGEPAHSFFLVRIGFVKVTETHPGGDLVLAYIGRGGFFGELSLLGGGVRTANCIALDHVEVVRIRVDDFNLMLDQFPDVRRGLEAVASERAAENRQRFAQVQAVPVDSFLAQGLMEAQSLLVLDLDKCTRCDQCVRACADAHDGVSRLIRDGLRLDHYLVATSCRQCKDPLCMVGCPVGAIRRRNSLEITIEDWCIGCGLCANNCPYGNINMHPFQVQTDDPAHPGRKIAEVKTKATACNLCPDHDEPNCVYACPHDAAHRVKPREFFADLAKESSKGITRP